MTLEEECRLSYYETVTPLNEKHGVYLVKNTEEQKIYVKKEIYVYNIEVYRYLQSLSSSCFPKIHECVECSGHLVLIEEFINGRTVGEHLSKYGVFSAQQAVSILCVLCDALGLLHGHNPPVIHRDIKPSNIMITNDGLIKMIDFNTARYYDYSRMEDTMLIGTKDYAAPEQFGFAQSDARTDIYALGVLLNVMLTGALPKIKTAEGALGSIIRTCTQLSPQQRYPNVFVLKQQLLAAIRETAFCPASGVNCVQKAPGFWRQTVFRKYHKYWPPGFRSGHLRNMAGAVVGYAAMIWFTLSLTFKDANGQQVTGKEKSIEQIAAFAVLLLPVLFTADYAQMRSVLPLQKHSSKAVRIAAGAVECFVLIFVAAMLIFLAGELFL